jgi:hypothetical protein
VHFVVPGSCAWLAAKLCRFPSNGVFQLDVILQLATTFFSGVHAAGTVSGWFGFLKKRLK